MAQINKQIDSDELVRKARTDENALGLLYELYYSKIFKFCVHRLYCKQTAEDITSTVFLQLVRKMNTFKGQTEDEFKNWLYAIAINHTNAYLRKTMRRKRLLENAAQMMTDKSSDSSERTDWTTLYAAIMRLKPKQQTIVTLRFFENLSFEQISKIINARISTVRVILYRALKKLRDHLQAFVDGDR
ncbi:MAG: RNA polymerase sigma factor [Planctomycetota bacterium]